MAVAGACGDGDGVSAGVVDEAEDGVEGGGGIWGAVGFEAGLFAARDTDLAFAQGVVGVWGRGGRCVGVLGGWAGEVSGRLRSEGKGTARRDKT